MNIAKTMLIIVILLSLVAIAGCNEGQTHAVSLADGRQVVLVPSATGFWQPQVSYSGSR